MTDLCIDYCIYAPRAHLKKGFYDPIHIYYYKQTKTKTSNNKRSGERR